MQKQTECHSKLGIIIYRVVKTTINLNTYFIRDFILIIITKTLMVMIAIIY